MSFFKSNIVIFATMHFTIKAKEKFQFVANTNFLCTQPKSHHYLAYKSCASIGNRTEFQMSFMHNHLLV